MKWAALSVLFAVALTIPSWADPNPQLVASVQSRLAQYGLHADVSQFATSTVAALHLTLSSPEGYFKTRQTLQGLLRNAKYKEQK
jgi:hypothetical protein